MPWVRHPLDVLSRALRPAVLPLAAAVAAVALYGWTLLSRADALLLPAYDTAFFQQVVWNVGHGGGFTSSFFPANFLGLHFEPLLAVPAVLERLWADARLLSLLNAVALGASAPAAYLFLNALTLPREVGGVPGEAGGGGPSSRRRGWLAAALAAPLPFWAALQQAARAGFHTEVLALPLVLLAGWAGLRGRWTACWALAMASLIAKEDQCYAVAVVGAVLFFHGPSRRHGAGLAAVAVSCGIAIEYAVMPAFRGPVVSQVDSYYRWLHTASPGEIALALANPAGWLAFGGMVASLAALPLLRPGWLALALPPLAADLLSAHQPQPGLRLQYALPLVIPLLVAAGLGARRLPERLPAVAIASMSVPALVLGAAAVHIQGVGGVSPAPAVARLQACVSKLPTAAPTAADDGTAAALASRPVLRLLTEARTGDFAVVDRVGALPDYISRPDRDRVLAGLASQGRRLLCDDGRFQLWSPAGG
jgi:uncharacterized membrane protein